MDIGTGRQSSNIRWWSTKTVLRPHYHKMLVVAEATSTITFFNQHFKYP